MQVCKICQVPLEGARELDEGNGDICMSCAIFEVALDLQRLKRQLRKGVKIRLDINTEILKMEID